MQRRSRTVGLPVVRDQRSGWRGIDTLKFSTVSTSHSNLDVWVWVRMLLAGLPSINYCFSPLSTVIASTRWHRFWSIWLGGLIRRKNWLSSSVGSIPFCVVTSAH